MKKLFLTLVILALLAAACASSTTTVALDDNSDRQAAPTADEPTEVAQETETAATEDEPTDVEQPAAQDDPTDDGDATEDEPTNDGDATEDEPVDQDDAATEDEPAEQDDAAADDEPSNDDAPVDASAAAEDESTDSQEPEPAPTVDTSTSAAILGSDDWCTVAAAVEENFDELEVAAFAEPEILERLYRQAGEYIAQAERLAPPIIAADVAKTVEGVNFLIAILEDAEWNFLNLDPAALEPIGNDLDIAGHNIQRYNFDVCGIGEDPGEPPVFEEPDTSSSTVPEAAGTIGEQAIAEFVAAGFTPAEAQCLLDNIDLTNPAALTDGAAILAVFTECGISLDRLSQLGG